MRGWRRRTIRRGAAAPGPRVARGTSRHGCSPRSKPCHRAIACCRVRRSPVSSAIRPCHSSSTAKRLNLPDPEDILKDPRSLVLPDRTDRAYAVCYSLVGAVLNNKTPERWQAAMIALGVACQEERRHSNGGGAHAVRQAQPPRRVHQAARRVPAVLRTDAAGEARSEGLRT